MPCDLFAHILHLSSTHTKTQFEGGNRTDQMDFTLKFILVLLWIAWTVYSSRILLTWLSHHQSPHADTVPHFGFRCQIISINFQIPRCYPSSFPTFCAMESFDDNLVYLDNSLLSTFGFYFLLNSVNRYQEKNIECKYSFFIWHLKKTINSDTVYNFVTETWHSSQILSSKINQPTWKQFLRQIKGMQSFWKSNTFKI